MERVHSKKVYPDGKIHPPLIHKVINEKFTGEENVAVVLSKIPNNYWEGSGYAQSCTICKRGYSVTNWWHNPASTSEVGFS